MVSVVWWGPSLDHLEAIRAYIEEREPRGARRVVQRILERVEALVDNPHIGRPGRVPGTRELVVTDTPFLVAYAVEGDQVIILAVLHGARRWPASFR